ncbi:hypothetical protein MMU07_03100 [Aquiflexum sp. LQ15W]|uniref:hypothetical protein n=1 Tax=Cognataquiflexum nitidum TaxID=2922272 RepID=UPI001F143ACC|nr:hypothetical protein [Cognataquiflexum nitidum]MCH6198552.1 hypothetical protein [Cognataquiflexum nitidum]
MLCGFVAKCQSLNSLSKNLLFLEDLLTYLGIDKLPAVSMDSDFNIKRDSVVFESVNHHLFDPYKAEMKPLEPNFLDRQLDKGKVIIIDS